MSRICKISTVLFSLTFVLVVSQPASAVDYKVFLLGGQSNMDGRGATSGLPAALQDPQTDVLLYEGSTLGALAPSGSDFGPEITFGRSIADAFPDEDFALIKYGVGGTNLYNDWDPNTGGTYSTFRTKVTNGLAALQSGGNTTEIVGMLWTQGERDAKADPYRTTAQYQADLIEFVADVRTRYGAGLPFYLSRLSSGQTNISAAGLTAIRTAQANVAAGDANAYMIDTDTFGMKGDYLHFSALGQQSLGTAFGDAYLGTGGGDPDPDPDPVQAAVIAHYSFDSDLTDDSGNNNHLINPTGTPTITTSAGEHTYGGGALDVDSTTTTQEYLNLTNSITFSSTDPWSVAFWGRRRPGTEKTTGMVLGDLTKNDFIWTTDVGSAVATGGIRFRNSGGANSDFGNMDDDHEYHHWVVIADGSGNITVYRDNVFKGTKSATTTFDITSVGQAYNAVKQSYNGQIDELYIFDGAIGSDVVNSLYTSNQVPEPSTLALCTLGLLRLVFPSRRRRKK